MSAISPVQAGAALSVSTAQNFQAVFDAIVKEVPPSHFFPPANIRMLLDKYNEAELALIYQDFCELKEETFRDVSKALDYVVTAGGPGSGKSTVLETLIQNGECPDATYDKTLKRAYIDTDRSCLLRMNHTYRADLESGTRTPQEAYEQWQKASQFLANVYLAIALKEGCAIAHGSTMAIPPAMNALSAMKNHYGYHTTLLHISCDEEVRKQSEVNRRAGGVVQCSDEDFVKKNDMFYTMLELYLTVPDKVVFSYRDKLYHSEWAAKAEKGCLEIYDAKAFDAICQAHDSREGEARGSALFNGLTLKK